jgi:GntR family transcriptional regulator
MPSTRVAVLSLADARRRRADRARQVADLLRGRVGSGDMPSGVLPSEAELVREFGTSRNAVRDALELLRAEGLIERQPGVGTVVVTEKYPHGLDLLLGLGETLRAHGDVTNEVRTSGLITAPPIIAARLKLPHGEPVVYIERLRRVGGRPLSLDLTYLVRDLDE